MGINGGRGVFKEYFLWLLKTVTFFVILSISFVMVIAILINIANSPEVLSTVQDKGKTVAVLEVSGPIMDTKDVVSDLYKYVFDDSVVGVVLRVDSPGGAVGPSQELYQAVRKLKEYKPIVASMGTVAASGGLYVALGASKVFANPGTVTGSIGVIMQFPNFQKVADKLGVDMITIKSGQLKDVGNPFREMSQEDRKFLQDTIDGAQSQFVNAVVEGRSLAEEEVRRFADGRIVTGIKALELGLVDEMGGLQDAARAVFTILGTPLKDDEAPKLIYPGDKLGRFRELLAYVGLADLKGGLGRYLNGGLFAIQ